MFSDQVILSREPESLERVYFQDCDPFGHLNNARYIDYFMKARTDHLRTHYGFDIFGWGKQSGQNWVVSKTQISYLRPAAISEEVLIQTRLIHADGRRLVVEGVMKDSSGKQIKSVGWVEFVYVQMSDGRPTHHPDELMHFFERVAVSDIYAPDRFDQRVTEIKNAARTVAPEADRIISPN